MHSTPWNTHLKVTNVSPSDTLTHFMKWLVILNLTLFDFTLRHIVVISCMTHFHVMSFHVMSCHPSLDLIWLHSCARMHVTPWSTMCHCLSLYDTFSRHDNDMSCRAILHLSWFDSIKTHAHACTTHPLNAHLKVTIVSPSDTLAHYHVMSCHVMSCLTRF